MLTTAAGTITPARVLVIGAGVAGLQAISTARRLGAVASAYDLRPAAKEQVQSLGGRFVELPIETKDAQDARGYGTQPRTNRFTQRQRELLGRVVAESDVVIAAAVIPGKKPPVLVTAEMVRAMAPGSVILDLAAERGGNCELTRAGETWSHTASPLSAGSISPAGALPCQPDVRAQCHSVSFAPGEGRQTAARPGRRNYSRNSVDPGRGSGQSAGARILRAARAGARETQIDWSFWLR